MLETYVFMTFLIFRDKWNGAGGIIQKYLWKPICRKYGYYTT